MIHCLSLVDQMVDKILFTPWYEAEKRDPMRTTQKTGWQPIPEGYKRLVEEFSAEHSIAVDKTQWDWTMPAWVIWAYVALKKLQCIDGDCPRYWNLVWSRLYFVLGPGTKFNMPNGLLWRQLYWGLMKSGWLLTLSLNSHAQHSQHAVACLRLRWRKLHRLWAMGDDMLADMDLTDEEIEEYWKMLETTGCLVKKIERNREFCGFSFDGPEVVNPLYPDKHQFILRSLKGDLEQETLLSYQLLYALSDNRWVDQFRSRMARDLGPASRLWAKGLVNLEVLREVPQWTDF